MEKNTEHNALKMIEDWVSSEIDGYGNKFTIEDVDSDDSETTAYINFENPKWGVHVRVDNVVKDHTEDPRDWGKFYVDMGEDNWEECKYYDWQVKYFWMALLS